MFDLILPSDLTDIANLKEQLKENEQNHAMMMDSLISDVAVPANPIQAIK